MNDLSRILKKALKDKEYRHAYFDELLNVSIATQIKVLREQRGRGWSQKDLADKVGMKQPRISVMENVNYSSWSINTLRKLAEAFDLRLRVSFESFGSGITEMEQFNRETLERPLFEDDPGLVEREEGRADEGPDFKPQVINIPCQSEIVLGGSASLESPVIQRESPGITRMGNVIYLNVGQTPTEDKMNAYQKELDMPLQALAGVQP